MQVFFSREQLAHAPISEQTRRGPIAYPENPARVHAILAALDTAGGYAISEPGEFAVDALQSVHSADYVAFLQGVHADWVAAHPDSKEITPVTFCVGGRHRPAQRIDQPGFYCFDTTPIMRHTFSSAWASARSALSAADHVLREQTTAYALTRPPGHHAASALYGGYCYLNNAALATARLRKAGTVAVLDIDYHHGNGTQEIFYRDGDVLVVSLHADPDRQYPFFWGAAAETGEDAGRHCNRNIPLPTGTDNAGYEAALTLALRTIQDFGPAHLVLAAGMDTLEGDLWGDFRLSVEEFGRIGAAVRELGLPVVVTQEGGYDPGRIGPAVVALLRGLKLER